MDRTFKIQIQGLVQGVGFRPYVYNLAEALDIKGYVTNNGEGVLIKMTTSKHKVETFLQSLLQKPPQVSLIKAHTIEEIGSEDFEDFQIIPSNTTQKINTPLTPDFAICEACKKEIHDPENRRFNYPFTTCVNCGPRYAITNKFPFERKHTSMSGFEMCPACQQEYTDPSDRRFHSQTNSCSTCGISMSLIDVKGKQLKLDQQEIIKKVASLISQGKIIALKNTSGYLLCCDAGNARAVQELRQKKKRPNKPFAVLYKSIERIAKEFDISKAEKEALQSTVTPILILENTARTSIATEEIAPKLNQTGVFLPSSSLLALLMDTLQNPIVCTSGNIHGSPIIAEDQLALNALSPIADYILLHDLDIQFPQDDAVMKFTGANQIILRRSRGLAPNYIEAKTNKDDPVLAMGAHLKSTFAFVPNSQTYVSQYFGNLDNFSVFERYKASIENYFQLFDCQASTILLDKHPQYQSTMLGKEYIAKFNTKFQEVQHHKAHFASVLGEHELFDSQEKILGVVWDGTGLGDDKAIWGGEFFLYQDDKIDRLSHFEYYDWLANDKMAKEPRLALFSLLDETQKNKIKPKFTATEWRIYTKTIQSNTLMTSSVGRIFDAVASALHLTDINTYEAEAAMLLENCASSYTQNQAIDFLADISYDQVPSGKLVQAILKAQQDGLQQNRLAYSFVYTLAKIILRMAQKEGVVTLVCSGGVFQNSLLVSLLSRLCSATEINLKLNRKLSPNDENISFGQLMYHQHIKD